MFNFEVAPLDRRVTVMAAMLAATALAVALAPSARNGAALPPAHTQSGAERELAQLPVAFAPNRGQVDARARYYAKGSGYSFYFSKSKAVLALTKGRHTQVLDLDFLGANPDPAITAQRPTGATVSELGEGKHQAALASYARVTYEDLWPGIDMVFFGARGKLNYEFHVAPGADPAKIRLAYRGAEDTSLARSGDLVLRTKLGRLTDTQPRSFQRAGGRRAAVESSYRLSAGGSFGFEIGHYDRARALVIDPGLEYSTYLGGSPTEDPVYGEELGGNDVANAIAVDAAGSAYVTGTTSSADYPTTPGAYDTAINPIDYGDPEFGTPELPTDAFVTKLTPSGSGLVYSTFLGGTGNDLGNGIAVDGAGSAYVTGTTTNFPVTAGAYDTSSNGSSDAFVAKLNAAGSALDYATYLGGTNTDEGLAVALDGSGSAYITGRSSSTDFPTTAGAYDQSYNGYGDAFVTKLTPAGASLDYSTYLGGGEVNGHDGGYGIAVDTAGSAYVTGITERSGFPTTPGAYDTSYNGGWDAFVTKLTPSGGALDYSTYLGGSDLDRAWAVAVDSSGSAYVTGETPSTDFPTTSGAWDRTYGGFGDAFVTKLASSGAALDYSTYLGGGNGDSARGIAVRNGMAYVTGGAQCGFPTTWGAFDTQCNGGGDAFMTALTPSGAALHYSTFLTGSGFGSAYGIAVDGEGDAYVAGYTWTGGLPVTTGAYDQTFNGASDAFVSKFDLGNYARPKAATPLEVPFVPAYLPCDSPNRSHGGSLSYSSCNPPQAASSELTVGTPDANGAPARSTGSVRLADTLDNPGTPADESDVRLTVSVTDVRRKADLADYTGSLRLNALVRATDKLNTPSTAPGGLGAGTVQDAGFGPSVPCAADPDPGIGSTCSLVTTVNALIPGLVVGGARSIWQFDQFALFDGGPDQDGNTIPGNTLFMNQGVFVP